MYHTHTYHTHSHVSYSHVSYSHVSYSHVSYAHVSYSHVSYSHVSYHGMSTHDIFILTHIIAAIFVSVVLTALGIVLIRYQNRVMPFHDRVSVSYIHTYIMLIST